MPLFFLYLYENNYIDYIMADKPRDKKGRFISKIAASQQAADKSSVKSAKELSGLESEMISKDQARLNSSKILNQLAQERLDSIKKGTNALREQETIEDQIKEVERARVGAKKEQLALSEQLINSLNKELKSTKNIGNAMGPLVGITSVLDKKFGSLLGNTAGISENVKTQLTHLDKQQKLSGGIVGKMQGMKILAGEVGKNLKNQLFSVEAIVIAMFDFSDQIAQIRRDTGLTYNEAQLLRGQMSAIALSSGKLSINSGDILKAFTGINQELGTSSTALISTFPKVVEETANITKNLRLSEKSASNLALNAIATGKDLKQQKLESLGAIQAVEKELGARLNIKQVMEEVGQVTGQIRAQLGGNIVALSKAVAVAKEFGMSLQEVANAGGRLLNFEENIGNELKAELLLGKELNLERARTAALTGDYETLTREINKNVGNFSDFTKLNVLQQKALAEAVGLTVDGLSDQLLKKENLNKLAQEARAMGNEDLAKQLEARSAQEKLTDAVTKLKSIFSDLVAGPLSAFLELLVLALKPIEAMMNGLTGILGLVGSLVGIQNGWNRELSFFESILGLIAGSYLLIKSYSLATLAIEKGKSIVKGVQLGYQVATNQASLREIAIMNAGLGKSIAKMATGIFSTFAKIPFGLGIPLAFAAIAGAISLISNSQKKNDVFSPGGGSGYGSRMLFGPEGAIALNNRDTVIAGTSLFRKGNDEISAPEGAINIASNKDPIDYDKLAGSMSNINVSTNLNYDPGSVNGARSVTSGPTEASIKSQGSFQ